MTRDVLRGLVAGGLAVLFTGTFSGCVEIDPSYGQIIGGDAGSTGPMMTGDGSTTAGSSDGSDGSGPGPQVDRNVAFVTAAQFPAPLGGFDAADEHCRQAAAIAGLEGTFVAWLGDANTSAASRLGNASGWVRTDGRVWATDRDALLNGRTTYPLQMTETGTLVGGSGFGFVFTGAQGIGGEGAPDDCGGWQDTNPESFGLFGYSDAVGGWWTSGALRPCNAAGHLYCLGIDVDAPVSVAPPAADARLVFETTATLASDAGRMAADDLCASDAAAAGLGGTFLALMAEPGEALFDRHAVGGGDWVRADGGLVFPADGNPGSWTSVPSPPVLDATGGLASSAAFWSGVGSTTAVATDESTCTGWTDATITSAPQSWTLLTGWLAGDGTGTCEGARGILCLEQ